MLIFIGVLIGWTLLGMGICTLFGYLAQKKIRKETGEDLSQEQIEYIINMEEYYAGVPVTTEFTIWDWIWEGFTWPWTIYLASRGDKLISENRKKRE